MMLESNGILTLVSLLYFVCIKGIFMNLNIAFLQLLPGKTQEENLEKGLQACREAKEQGADIALFPEIWNIGYDIDQEPEMLRKLAVSVDSPFVTAFQNLAKELQMAIGITFLESYHPAPRNTICLFDMYGKPVLRYAKVHTCAFDVEAMLTPGDTFYVETLQTAKGPVKVGAMICYDREFPESARIMMLKGAELLLVPNACPMEINRLAQLLRCRMAQLIVIPELIEYLLFLHIGGKLLLLYLPFQIYLLILQLNYFLH